MRRLLPISALLMVPLFTTSAFGQNRAYCTITAIESQQLSNGVQITVKADGVLDWVPEGGDWDAF